jgi:hypothetical protein
MFFFFLSFHRYGFNSVRFNLFFWGAYISLQTFLTCIISTSKNTTKFLKFTKKLLRVLCFALGGKEYGVIHESS